MEPSSRDRVFNVHHRNVLERLGSSFGSRILCLIVLCAACCLLFWNEGQAVSKARLIARGQRPIHEMVFMDNEVDDQEEAEEDEEEKKRKIEEKEELVHVIGPLYTTTDLTDKEFGLQVRAVKLRRNVEMFQWVESQQTRAVDEKGEIVDLIKYSYSKEWRPQAVNSSVFGRYPEYHKNPPKFPIPSKTFRSQMVKVKGMILSEGLGDKIDVYRSYYVDDVPYGFQRHSNFLYRGQNPYSPAIGDLRITFEVAGMIGSSDETVSIIARKDKDRLMPYPMEDGSKLEMLYTGRLSVNEMFERAVAARVMLRWSLRVVGWLLLFLSVGALAKPIGQKAKSVPVVNEFLQCGRTLFSFFLSAALAVLICSSRWIVFRPEVSVLWATLGISPFLLVWFYRRYMLKAVRHRD